MSELTSNANFKKTIYKNEISYRMVISMAEMYWSCQYKKEMLRYGLMLIKPDALMMGKISEIFSILQEAGYELIYYVRKNIGSARSAERKPGMHSCKSKAIFYARLFNLDTSHT